MPKDFEESFAKGYADGLREAEYQKEHGALEKFIRDLGYNPRKSDDPAYREGFKKGVEDGGWDKY